MSGRPPKDHSLRLIHGDTRRGAGDDPASTPAPLAVDEDLEPPATLRKPGRTEWERIIVEMRDAGILSRLDLGMLFVYCDLWESYLELRRHVRRKDGRVYTTDTGFERSTERSKQLTQVTRELRQVAALLGLAPNARRGLRVDDGQGESALERLNARARERNG